LFSCGTTTEGDCFLAEWDEKDGVVKRTFSGFRTNSAGMVQFDSAKSRYLAVGVDNQIKFWDVNIINVLTSTDADGGLPVSIVLLLSIFLYIFLKLFEMVDA